jgi:glycosyltransferase involved in cell wall biosynthesis
MGHSIRPSRQERSKSMHIAQVAPLTEAIPPKLYGGTERVVSWLTEELIALGHEVTLFASGDSVTSARLEAVWPRALRLDGSVRDPNALHMLMLEKVYQRAGEFDFLHCHLDYYPFSLFSRQPTPFATTLHGRLDLPEHQPVFDEFSSLPVISISNAQRRPLPQAHWVRTVHHGLPERLLMPTSHSSAASPRRRASIARSGSRSIAACRSRSPRRSTRSTASTSTSKFTR